MIYPGNKRVEYGYDKPNRMTSVKDWGNRTTTYQYDVIGRLTTTTNPNGTSSTQTYDDASRLATLANRGPGSTVISNYAYTLDPVGNHLQVQQQEPIEPTPILGAFSYEYDAEDRIQNMEGIAQTNDANGNLTGSGSDAALGYDFENHLVRYQSGANDWRWRYDGTGKRLELDMGDNEPQRFVLDVNTSLTQVIGVSDKLGEISEFYIYGLGLVSKVDETGAATYYHYDSRGSTISMTNSSGQPVASFVYDPFGRLIGRLPTDAIDRFTFLGRHGVMNDYNGFHYVRARHYSVRRGRFLQKDPFFGIDDQSQTLNRYVYALNNPVRLVDISGFSAREATVIKNSSGTTDIINSSLVEASQRAERIQRYNNETLAYELESIRHFRNANILQGIYDSLQTTQSLLTGDPIGVGSKLLHQSSSLLGVLGYETLANVADAAATTGDRIGTIVGISSFGKSTSNLVGSLRTSGINMTSNLGLSVFRANSNLPSAQLWEGVATPGIEYLSEKTGKVLGELFFGN
jgi:RHS repeat-associated protein